MEFSRVVGEEILQALEGPFAPLVEFVRSQPSPRLFDLRLSRGDNVLLYYAGYGALRIAPHRGGLTLRVGKSHSGPSGFDPSWSSTRPSHEWPRALPAVLDYLRGLPDYVAAKIPSALREGAVQGRLCATAQRSFEVIDRESAFSFEGEGGGTGTRELLIAAISLAIDDALDAELSPNTWTHTRNTDPGGELDCLAIDDQGRLLAIEVKPADEKGTGAWAPAQAMVYAQLFRLWIRRNPELARSTLQTMADQRVRLGLAAPATLAPELPPVVPVVAFGAPTADPDQAGGHEQAVSRAKLVDGALRRGNLGAPLVEWLRVEADGTAKPL